MPQASGRQRATVRRVLQIIFALLLVIAIGGVIAVAVFPVPLTTANTELYILGANGTAANYPSNLTVGEQGTVTVGITNNEHRQMTYRLVAKSAASTFVSREVTVARGETWEDEVTFSFESPGEKTVEFLLYKGESEEVYRRVYVQVNVTAEA